MVPGRKVPMVAELVRQVRDSIEAETGEKCSLAYAEVEVDWMCDAFVHLVEGAGVDVAVRRSPDTAKHLAHRWTGEDGRKLRAAIKRAQDGVPLNADGDPVAPVPEPVESLPDDDGYEGPTCSICDALGHGYPGGPPCPLEDSGRYEPEEPRGWF